MIDFTKFNSTNYPVPNDLMEYTVGHTDLLRYHSTGLDIAKLMASVLFKYTGLTFQSMRNILDFGSGAGRIITKFPVDYNQSFYGCDLSKNLVTFCRSNFPHINFVNSNYFPPLCFKDDYFDLIYSFSVFSHLSLEAENLWLEELRRIGRTGCVYLITVHGNYWIDSTLGSEVDKARDSGFYFKKVHPDNKFPDYYEASFHTKDYIMDKWRYYFEVLDVVSGDKSSNCSCEATSSFIDIIPSIGQDIVVARKIR